MLDHPPAPAAPLHPNPWLVAGTLCQRELVRFIRQGNRVFGALGQPIIFWLLFSEGLRPAGLAYAHFFPGTLVMILLFTAIFATISIIEDRREGFLQSVLVAPVPRWSMVLGKILGGTLLAVMQGMIFLLLGWLTLDLPLSPLRLLSATLLMTVVAFALTAMGFNIAWRMDSTQGFHAIMSVLLLPMWLLSGAFFPGDAGWLKWIVKLNPLTYGVTGLREYLESNQMNSATLSTSWLVSVLFALIMFGLAWRTAARRTTGDLL